MIRIFFLALTLIFALAVVSPAQADDATAIADQDQAQLMSNQINSGQVSITSYGSKVRYFASPYQLYPPNLATDFGNGNTYGNFIKVAALFSIKKRFTRSELEAMRKTSGTRGKFRMWTGKKQEGERKPTDCVAFMWELPIKPVIGMNGKPQFNEKGQPVMMSFVPNTWTQVGTGTASVSNGDQDSASLIAEYGLYCLDNIEKCNTVFFVGEGYKTYVQAWGANLSLGYTHASVNTEGDASGIGGAGVGVAYGKTSRLADPWLQGHFIYDSASGASDSPDKPLESSAFDSSQKK